MEFAKERALHVIIDDIYMFSVFDIDTFESCLSFTAQWPDPPRTHYLWSFSKDFAMSGSRCGVIYSQNPEVHAAIGRDIGFYHQIPGILQRKLTNMLRDEEWVDMYLAESRRRLKHHARIVMSCLDDLGLSYIKPTGTLYIWVDFTPIFKADPSETEAEQIFMKMIEYKVYIPSAKGFNGNDPRYFRIVFSVPENYLREAMERLGEFVKEYLS